MPKFKVDDLVRVKAEKGIAPGYWNAVGPIVKINLGSRCCYIVLLYGRRCLFDEDELEKI